MSTLPIETVLKQTEAELQQVVRDAAPPADDGRSLSELLSTFDKLRRTRETIAIRESLRALRAA
jgi:hypothetical protein